MTKKITLIKSLSVVVTLLCAVNFGFGQSIFSNDINGNSIVPVSGTPYTTGQVADANITVSGIGAGSGILGVSSDNIYNAQNWNTSALDANDYFEFTLTPNPGYEIDFTSFEYTGQATSNGPTTFAFRSSMDGYTADLGTPTASGAIIDLSAATFQNITTAITFRIYGWNSSGFAGTFSINDFTFNGYVSTFLSCAGTSTTWNGSIWDNGTPDATMPAIINENYTTGTNGNITACSLTVNAGYTLDVSDYTYVDIQNDVDVYGTIAVENHGAFKQHDATSTFIVKGSGNSYVRKSTSVLNNWYDYTYWSAPVSGLTIGTSPLVDSDMRYWFKANNYLDDLAEVANTGVYNAGHDDIDDDGNDWQYAHVGDPMTPGMGYAATHSQIGYQAPPRAYDYDFYGPFNNGDVTVSIAYNGANGDNDWNFIGNPYPCALDFDAFYAVNSSVIGGAAYLWSHRTGISSSASGNQGFNFSQNDYVIINVAGGIGNNFDNGDGNIPNDYIPSGQGFFISGIANGPVTFNNSMRIADGTSNSQFFKNTNTKGQSVSQANKLWANLTSDNGVFNQILIAYIDGATNGNDGMAYDAPRNLSSGVASMLYTLIDGVNDKKYAIQGKAKNSINLEETIPLGFYTSINSSTLYTLSVAKKEGDFLTNNPIYLKDNLTNTLHDLSTCDYTFTSEVGEFNKRFEIVFSNKALATNDFNLDDSALKILQIGDSQVRFKASSNLTIKTVSVFDLLGRQLYALSGSHNEETYNLPKLKNAVFIAKVKLSNGSSITKKGILK